MASNVTDTTHVSNVRYETSFNSMSLPANHLVTDFEMQPDRLSAMLPDKLYYNSTSRDIDSAYCIPISG